MSFNCELCGYQNNEIQSGGQVQDQGIKFKVKIQSSEDLCRQIVKSDYATLTVPEIELEIPPNSQKGGKQKKKKPKFHHKITLISGLKIHSGPENLKSTGKKNS